MTAIIPVIDILQGQVVRAVRGERQSYRPIVSPLCASSEPLTVARVLCDHCASERLYVADLDALQGGAVQTAVLQQLLQAMPTLELWLDAGFADGAAAEAMLARFGDAAGRVVSVFGSESIARREALQNCFAGPHAASRVLSLDRRDGRRLDAAGCWDAPQLWPERVIVMTLERVGSDAGPDLDTLMAVRDKSPTTRLIGAGGVRHPADLAQADAAGAEAWLIASALHDLRLPRVQRP